MQQFLGTYEGTLQGLGASSASEVETLGVEECRGVGLYGFGF